MTTSPLSVPSFPCSAPSRVSTQLSGDGESVEAREAREFFTALGYAVLPNIASLVGRKLDEEARR